MFLLKPKKRVRLAASIAMVAALALPQGAFAQDSARADAKSGEVIKQILPADAEWRYWYGTVDNPAAPSGWMSDSFDDSAWASAKGPLGYGASKKVTRSYTPITADDGTPYAKTGEVGKVPATYFRTTVTISSTADLRRVIASMSYDDAACVYVNGALRAKAGAFGSDYKGKDFDPATAAAITGGNATGAKKVDVPILDQALPMKASWFREGKNTIAVAVFQDTGSSSDCLMGLSIQASNYLELAKPGRVNASLNGNPSTRIGLSWISDGNGGAGSAQYLKAGASDDKSKIDWKKAKSVAAVQEGDAEYSNKALLEGLEPAKRYFYRVGNDGLWSEAGEFTTAEKGSGDGSFSFIDVTDPQGSKASDFAHWAANMDGALKRFPGSAFVSCTGDFVNDGLSSTEWKLCLDSAASALLRTSLVPVTGNHEGYDYLGGFWKHFNVESQKKAVTAKGSYYSFDYENAHFTVLNSDEKENDDLSAAQLQWMEADLSKARADKGRTWLIVLLHRSLYSGGDHSTDTDVVKYRSSIGALLDKYEVDLVLGGHDHVYLRTKPILTGVAQSPDVVVKDGIEELVNPRGTVHVIPATISNKNYELTVNADYRILQPAQLSDATYPNGRPKYVSYSLLSGSRFYPEGMPKDAAVFVKVDIKKNELRLASYAVVDGEVAQKPFDSVGILKDKAKPKKAAVAKKADIPAWKLETSATGTAAASTLAFEDSIYDPEEYFFTKPGVQGPTWFYYYEKGNKLFELTPMKGKKVSDGTTGAPIDTDMLYSEFPAAKNIGNDSVNNGSVRAFDGASDGNARPEGPRLTLVPFANANDAAGKDAIVVAWKAPKAGTISIGAWNPEFVGISPAEKYLNTSSGFRVDLRVKSGTTGKPTEVADYEKDSTSVLKTRTWPEVDGVVSGGAPKLIDKGGPFDGQWTTGAKVETAEVLDVAEGDYVYFIAHCGNNYGWRGVILDSKIRYIKR